MPPKLRRQFTWGSGGRPQLSQQRLDSGGDGTQQDSEDGPPSIRGYSTESKTTTPSARGSPSTSDDAPPSDGKEGLSPPLSSYPIDGFSPSATSSLATRSSPAMTSDDVPTFNSDMEVDGLVDNNRTVAQLQDTVPIPRSGDFNGARSTPDEASEGIEVPSPDHDTGSYDETPTRANAHGNVIVSDEIVHSEEDLARSEGEESYNPSETETADTQENRAKPAAQKKGAEKKGAEKKGAEKKGAEKTSFIAKKVTAAAQSKRSTGKRLIAGGKKDIDKKAKVPTRKNSESEINNDHLPRSTNIVKKLYANKGAQALPEEVIPATQPEIPPVQHTRTTAKRVPKRSFLDKSENPSTDTQPPVRKVVTSEKKDDTVSTAVSRANKYSRNHQTHFPSTQRKANYLSSDEADLYDIEKSPKPPARKLGQHTKTAASLAPHDTIAQDRSQHAAAKPRVEHQPQAQDGYEMADSPEPEVHGQGPSLRKKPVIPLKAAEKQEDISTKRTTCTSGASKKTVRGAMQTFADAAEHAHAVFSATEAKPAQKKDVTDPNSKKKRSPATYGRNNTQGSNWFVPEEPKDLIHIVHSDGHARAIRRQQPEPENEVSHEPPPHNAFQVEDNDLDLRTDDLNEDDVTESAGKPHTQAESVEETTDACAKRPAARKRRADGVEMSHVPVAKKARHSGDKNTPARPIEEEQPLAPRAKRQVAIGNNGSPILALFVAPKQQQTLPTTKTADTGLLKETELMIVNPDDTFSNFANGSSPASIRPKVSLHEAYQVKSEPPRIDITSKPQALRIEKEYQLVNTNCLAAVENASSRDDVHPPKAEVARRRPLAEIKQPVAPLGMDTLRQDRIPQGNFLRAIASPRAKLHTEDITVVNGASSDQAWLSRSQNLHNTKDNDRFSYIANDYFPSNQAQFSRLQKLHSPRDDVFLPNSTGLKRQDSSFMDKLKQDAEAHRESRPFPVINPRSQLPAQKLSPLRDIGSQRREDKVIKAGIGRDSRASEQATVLPPIHSKSQTFAHNITNKPSLDSGRRNETYNQSGSLQAKERRRHTRPLTEYEPMEPSTSNRGDIARDLLEIYESQGRADTDMDFESSRQDDSQRHWQSAVDAASRGLADTMHNVTALVLRKLVSKEVAITKVVDEYKRNGRKIAAQLVQRQNQERQKSFATFQRNCRDLAAAYDGASQATTQIGDDLTFKHGQIVDVVEEKHHRLQEVREAIRLARNEFEGL
ncbi:hypothetical protein BJ170DRAFT_677139 [Xylariales sp. AK1849]|nr:hypothetical protein BJ170DRAFT_677139 [Xylariales sp. AK1849]